MDYDSYFGVLDGVFPVPLVRAVSSGRSVQSPNHGGSRMHIYSGIFINSWVVSSMIGKYSIHSSIHGVTIPLTNEWTWIAPTVRRAEWPSYVPLSC